MFVGCAVNIGSTWCFTFAAASFLLSKEASACGFVHSVVVAGCIVYSQSMWGFVLVGLLVTAKCLHRVARSVLSRGVSTWEFSSLDSCLCCHGDFMGIRAISALTYLLLVGCVLHNVSKWWFVVVVASLLLSRRV